MSRQLKVRLCLTALAVAVCYLFDWRQLRFITSELNLRLDLLAGIHLQRSTYDTVLWRGEIYRYGVACTFADVWCGAVPLLWSLRRSIIRNLLYILVFGLALLFFNVARLSFSDLLFAFGIPWDLAHNVVSGVCYFVIWTWIWRHRDWT
ncbi:MAG TPA: hypothetical protein VN622_01105 [Clostridia bacterium]|nr:hypothetical protein [Clostridia bacterium]